MATTLAAFSTRGGRLDTLPTMGSTSGDARYHAVVSDLHFGDGLALEDFVYEAQFAAFLDHVHQQGRDRGGSSELVINGDFIDFLQIEPLAIGPWRGASAKLERVAAAHRSTFDALGRFAADGNRVVVLPGNHDVELAFAEVQQTLRGLIASGHEGAASRVVFDNEAPLGAHFRGWQRGPFVHRLPGVYIEHGNQFDVANFFDHADFFTSPAKDAVNLPWGSHFVLDLFNGVEARYRFIDKLRPRAAAMLILWLIDSQMVKERVGPLRALGPRLYAELRRYKRQHDAPAGGGSRGPRDKASPDDAFLALLAENADDLETVDRLRGHLDAGAEGGTRGLVTDKLSAAYAAIFRAALRQMTATKEAIGELDDYAVAACELARSEGAEIAIFGHTHGIKDLVAGGVRYLNTGTWIGLVDLDTKALEAEGSARYRQLLERLSDARTFVPLELLTFAEIAYPNGKLEANVRVFRDGKALAPDPT